MLEKTEQAYYLTKTEFSVLAGLKGMTRIYGFQFPEAENMTQTDVYQALNALVGRGLVKNMESYFVLAEKTEELFSIISTVKYMDIIYSEFQSFPMQCIYVGEKTVIAQMDGTQNKYIRLELILNEELGDYLEQRGFLPMQPEMAYIQGDEEELRLPETVQKSTVIECHDIGLSVVVSTICIITQPLYDLILVQGLEADQLFYYSKEKICELLFMNLEEE